MIPRVSISDDDDDGLCVFVITTHGETFSANDYVTWLFYIQKVYF